MQYPTHWYLVVIGRYIKAVYGAALREDAEQKAVACGGFVVWIGAYGMPYHAGQTIETF